MHNPRVILASTKLHLLKTEIGMHGIVYIHIIRGDAECSVLRELYRDVTDHNELSKRIGFLISTMRE